MTKRFGTELNPSGFPMRTKNDIKSLYGIALSMDIAQRVINAVHESLFDDFGISKVDRRVHGTEIIEQLIGGKKNGKMY